jgi:hypothetical protein
MRFAFAFALLAAGCNTSGLVADDAGADLSPAPPDLSRPPADLVVVASGIGDACSGAGGMDQGSCNDGQWCIPPGQFGFTDGYCTAQCNANMPCPSDAKCVVVGGNFSLCFVRCTQDSDCREPDYTCSLTNQVCVPPNAGMGGAPPPATNDGGACVTPVVEPGKGLAGPFGPALQISGGAMSLEAECEIAVDPNGQDIVVAWNDLTGGGALGATGSLNGGVNWGARVPVPGDKLVDMNRQQSDPVVARDAQGGFWVAMVGYDFAGGGQTSNMRIFASRSMDNGASFNFTTLVSPMNEWTQGGGLDKPWIAVSPLDDSIWVTWMRQPPNAPLQIRLAHSTDYGMSWSTQTISDGQNRPNLDRNLAQIAVDTDGKVVVAWVEIASQQYGATDNRVFLQRINPDGTRNGPNTQVTRGSDSPVFDDPSVAIANGTAYVGFISGSPNARWDVRAAASLDGGGSFMGSVKVNDDATCATHFHHQLVTDGKGNVHAIWYDNRFLAGNVFYASSGPADAMNPLKFGPNVFVNDVPMVFTIRRDQSNWIGDYLGLAIAGNQIFAAWTDNRTNNRSHIFFAKGNIP